MATKTQIRNDALRGLGVLESGGTPSSDEITDVELEFDRLYAYLATKDATYWDSDENVPDEAAHHFTAMLKARIADEFAYDRKMALEAEAINALRELIDLAMADRVPTTIEADYF